MAPDWPVSANLCRPGVSDWVSNGHDVSVMGRRRALRVSIRAARQAGREPGHGRRRAPPLNGPRRIPNESLPLFPPCHGRAGPGSRDFVGHRRRAGAIAAAAPPAATAPATPAPAPAHDPCAAASRDQSPALPAAAQTPAAPPAARRCRPPIRSASRSRWRRKRSSSSRAPPTGIRRSTP